MKMERIRMKMERIRLKIERIRIKRKRIRMKRKRMIAMLETVEFPMAACPCQLTWKSMMIPMMMRATTQTSLTRSLHVLCAQPNGNAKKIYTDYLHIV